MREFETDKDNKSFVSRRDVFLALGGLGLVTALTGLLRETVRFLMPPVSQARPATVIAGSPADFSIGELTPLADGPVFIGQDAAGLFALSAVCTHLGCTVAHNGQELVCPCHGSRFAADGTNLSGPAARPLPYLALKLSDNGQIEVDLSQVVEPAFRLKLTSKLS